jgi:hypothetical protein
MHGICQNIRWKLSASMDLFVIFANHRKFSIQFIYLFFKHQSYKLQKLLKLAIAASWIHDGQ